LREEHGWTYGASTVIGAGKYFKIKIDLPKNSVTDSAVIEFVKEIKRIRTEKVSEELLKNVKGIHWAFCNASRKTNGHCTICFKC
jgi:hypothetical protein